MREKKWLSLFSFFMSHLHSFASLYKNDNDVGYENGNIVTTTKKKLSSPKEWNVVGTEHTLEIVLQ
jgi:hypothetical protein